MSPNNIQGDVQGHSPKKKRRILLACAAIVVAALIVYVAIILVPHRNDVVSIVSTVSKMQAIGFLWGDPEVIEILKDSGSLADFLGKCAERKVAGSEGSISPQHCVCQKTGKPWRFSAPRDPNANLSSWVLLCDDTTAYTDGWRYKLVPAFGKPYPLGGESPSASPLGGTQVIHSFDAGKLGWGLIGRPFNRVPVLFADGRVAALSPKEAESRLASQEAPSSEHK